MKIAIDLNDVIRDYTDNFIRTYLINYDREYDTSNLDIWTNDMESVLPFRTRRSYEKFVYEDFAYDLYGKCETCYKNLPTELSSWLFNLKEEKEDVEVMFVSPMEFGPSIGYSFLFVSKLNCGIREVYFPTNSMTIWDRCDVLITANPALLNNKPEGKISVKIKKEYNERSTGDYEYESFHKFINDENNFLKQD